MCGGTPDIAFFRVASVGLSPRVRGNPGLVQQTGTLVRSIPACAGEPVPGGAEWASSGVYPRVCGGTTPERAGRPICHGLSPRVRGNPAPGCIRRVSGGSIPACAGEPRIRRPRRLRTRVYPRVCGGTPRRRLPGAGTSGLSPRVRGNLCFTAWTAWQRGSIPACAGEPRRRHIPRLRRRVYPRVCGGTWVATASAASSSGLSPRVRGNPPDRFDVAVPIGSIPACAGEPAIPKPGVGMYAVYPRVCGGTDGEAVINRESAGLSPRVRGNPHLRR